ncbi:acyl transferase domain-containing protein/acyl carrier protein [Variovorax boronicumulans]|uniref:type I polyketide synthase n=1 Tax=Variovorax boronicumulans TaxID=436515 RepID=UPI0027860932|nr:type I polyketide synthase [Variovorax boronicumulans]MDP9989737.1 acyl transferase domain-containing protein/acyl carrier protein [Variovorax boronicumulans]MDQ0005633.1 acyl transferase domain-containing protein/acyl carrier protein [Variovorax boronicumulans]
MTTAFNESVEPTGLEIAIVGLSGRFPGADDVDAFWRNIEGGVESVARFTDEQLRERGVPQSLLDDPDYVKAGVMFEGFDQFDAGFFGYTPREAENLDPQQRVFLECASAALEHAGCDPERWPGKVGVYAGEGANVYLIRNLLPSFGLGAHTGIADLLGLMSGNSGGSLCTRVAYKLNLRGPAVSVQTACSTSLTAVHTACQALLSHDCDMALAGGVWLNLLQEGGYRYQAGAILSPDGHCRAFDADAAGTVIGSGAGVVALKRLDEALRDGDTIHAVIKGTAANNDGSAKVGFTAPSIDGQAEVIRAAQLIAGVSADTIGYIEAHGTGTTLGDPIEIAALTQAFRADTERRGFCAVGSVKTNIGHLDAAAGVAGLIKATMALKHGVLPPSLHFTKPNPQIDFASSPFYVNAQRQSWPEGRTPRRAGVSSFGIGGTNVHVVLEEAPRTRSAQGKESPWQVLPLSAKGAGALKDGRERLAVHLRESGDAQSLADVASTLQEGRRPFAWRSAVVANQSAVAAEMLAAPPALAPKPVTAAPEVVFLFPGSGTQHALMGADLYRESTVFREEMDRCFALLRKDSGVDLQPLLFPPVGGEAAANERLLRVEFAQPALFVVGYAMARWWMHCGVRPALMLGHSLGEYVAACLAGVFSIEDALRIVAARGRLLQTVVPGAMTAVSLSEKELAPLLAMGCDLAAVNGEALCVLSGPVDAIERVEEALRAKQHAPRRLHVSIAFHSRLVDPVVAELERVVAAVPRNAPVISFLSNASGKPITAQEATDPAYWGRHLRGAVRFAEGLREIFATPGRAVLEVGPGETLAGLARLHADSTSAAGIWASQAHPQQIARNAPQLANAVAGLWTVGVDIDWAACRDGASRHRVSLPTYAFQRQRFWVDPAAAAQQPVQTGPTGLFYVPAWKRTALSPHAAQPAVDRTGCTLILGDVDSFTDRLARTLRAQGAQVAVALRGKVFARTAALQYTLRAGERADHAQLLREVEAEAGAVTQVFHLWSLDAGRPAVSQADVFERSYFSLLALAQALDGAGGSQRAPLALTVIADGIEDVAGTEALSPEKATLRGLAKVLGQESPSIACRIVDVVLPAPESAAESELARRVAEEAAASHDEAVVAYRGPHRWTKGYEALATDTPGVQRLRKGGVYLITGGLGGVGLALARHLSKTWQARLVLLGRTPVPERAEWARLIEAADQPPALRRRLQQLTELEAAGAEVLTVAADVTDPTQLRNALETVHARFGAVNGVVHAVIEPDHGMVSQRTRAQVEAAFAPKIAGTRALLDAVASEPLDFVLFCSSIATLLGGLGFSDYAAANDYLDAFASAHRRSSALPVFSVNWDAWRDVGAAAGKDMPEGMGLDERNGALAFERIVNGPDLPQVVVSASPLAPRLRPLRGLLDAMDDEPEAAAPARAGHPRPVLQSAFVAPEGDLEEGLAELWTEALGIAPVGVNDNLFELGGDSLLAIRLLSKVRKAYGVDLAPAAFFKAPTVAELAALVELRLIEDIEAAGLDDEAGEQDRGGDRLDRSTASFPS